MDSDKSFYLGYGMGFDSREVKEAVIGDFDAKLDAIRRWAMRHALAAQEAVCSICGVVLHPWPGDDNHHVSALSDRLPYAHYCAEHCPACNQGADHED